MTTQTRTTAGGTAFTRAAIAFTVALLLLGASLVTWAARVPAAADLESPTTIHLNGEERPYIAHCYLARPPGPC